MATLPSESDLIQQEQTSNAQSLNLSNGEAFDAKVIRDGDSTIDILCGEPWHRGDPCPSVDHNYMNASQSFTLADVNGIHKTRIAFCQCKLTDPYNQLLDASIFPAMHKQPEMGFMFSLLESYYMESLALKKLAYDFITMLRRKTTWDFPEDVPNVYSQFRHAVRVWHTLQTLKQSSKAHNIDSIMESLVSGWPKKNVMVSCFACPQPGFNMDEDPVDEEELCLQGKRKPDDPDDIALLAHMGLYTELLKYVNYMKAAPDSTEKSMCVKLKAAQNQNKAKFAGVIAVTCVRHSMFLHHSMVDLEKGKKFALTNFALIGALFNLVLPPHIVLTYDIACQYSINLLKCFDTNFKGTKYFDQLKDTIVNIYQWLLNYSNRMGRTCSEQIEDLWAEAKQASGMTKEMNPGHHMDTLTALQNNWNPCQNVKAL
uniref:CxC2-like cysteine cluster KDZ transposase-associated domain-containing protein n=1 Tax=Moniliophthora roreri TaxID=221103 RepID=A0A0W0FXD1_MONRR